MWPDGSAAKLPAIIDDVARLDRRLCVSAENVPERMPTCTPAPELPAQRLRVGEWLSLVEHLVRDQGVGGSNPLSPTNHFNNLSAFLVLPSQHCRRFCRRSRLSGFSARILH